MAEKKFNTQIPRQSVTYMALCLIGLLILILGGIVPASRTIRGLDNQITALQQQTEERKMLAPLYISLQKQSEKKEPEALPLPAPVRLSPSRINTLPQVFRLAASASGMSLVSVAPDLSALGGGTQFIPVIVKVKGNTPAFRKFLIQIGGLPFVHHIEEVAVEVGPDSRDCRLKILIAIG